jgi:hypothetical protein
MHLILFKKQHTSLKLYVIIMGIAAMKDILQRPQRPQKRGAFHRKGLDQTWVYYSQVEVLKIHQTG